MPKSIKRGLERAEIYKRILVELGRVLTILSNDSHKFLVPGDLNLSATTFRSSPKHAIFRRSPSSAQKQKPNAAS